MVLAEQGLKLSSLNVRMHLGSTEGIKSFLRCSNCMGIVSICALERELKEGDFQVIDIEGLQFKRHFCFVSAQGQESDTVLNFMRFVRHFLSGSKGRTKRLFLFFSEFRIDFQQGGNAEGGQCANHNPDEEQLVA